ncbi:MULTISPECIES: NTP transferase domain-containing protein [unclassified Spirosoma]|uniref:NTP transferase domain-containing protein n=1 Tax=unclassified Spirosoma TaxID=2621999 RepID=UPI000964EA90|nr:MULTISPECIES: NTP transferase domain-containing protein [unclassified Spirosoma]MBN8822609.1 NTP transferase domain-containing protein [Spirosoma sp.]OJW74101.1 MAG: molybdenum cofactor guanylyltransferase [Spirosoma sp. 48-14]
MSKINGLILTGGRSTRMGTDKSQLIYHGKSQRDHLTELLRPYCSVVFWSVNSTQEAELEVAGQLQLRLVDRYDLPGPINGILSAFAYDPQAAWFVVACDMPLVSPKSIDALVKGRNPAKLATVFYDSDGQLPEPLLGIYEPAFGPVLHQAVAEGAYSPRQILLQNDILLLTAPDLRELTNINNPEERQKLGL